MAGCSIASTPSCSRSSPATTWRSRSSTESPARDRRADEVQIRRQASGLARGLDDHRRASLSAIPDHLAQGLDLDLALPEALVTIGAGAGRVAGVVGVQEVDLAGDREHPLDG